MRSKLVEMMGSMLVASKCQVAALVAVMLCVAPQPSFSESLEEVLAAAYSSNPALQAERARQRALDENVPQASAGWKPTITVTGSYGEQDISTISGGGPETTTDSNPVFAAATLTQPLFSGGRTFFGVRRARAEVSAGRARLRSFEQQVLLDTVVSYFNVLRDEATVALSHNNIAVLQRQLEAAQDRFRVGEITRTDVAQSQARLKFGETTLISSEARLVSSRSSFQSIIGQAPGTLVSDPPLPTIPSSEEEALEIASRNNPVLEAARQTERAATSAVKVAYGGLLPTASVELSAVYNESEQLFGSNTVDVERETTAVTGQLRVPIYQAGAEYASIRRAKQTSSQTRLELAQAERTLRENVTNAWEALRSAQASIRANEEQVRANEIALEGVNQEAQVGARTVLDVLDAEQELLDSRVSLVQSGRDQYVAAYALLGTMGLLSAEWLELPTEIYDAKANARSLKWKQFWPGTKTTD